MEIKELGFDEWDSHLPAAGIDTFHTADALQVLDSYTSSELLLLGGFKGQQPVGLVPLFVRDHGIGKLITSPPPRYGIVRLGPIVMPTSPKQRKRDSVNKDFVQEVIEFTGADATSTMFRMVCDPSFTDPRPFQWAGFEIDPSFTYQLELNGKTPEEVLQGFSRDRRDEIRSRDDVPIDVQKGGKRDARHIYESIEERYREQGLKVPHDWEFIADLIDALPERLRVYTAESSEGEFLSGIIVLYSNDTAYNWKGGVKRSDRDFSVSPNSLIHWQIINDILEDPALESIDRYDMYSANEERLSRYKSSFGGSLRSYYIVESSGLPLNLAKRVYRMVAHRKSPFRR